MSALLLHRLLIGVFLGTMDSRPDPDDVDTRHAQTTCLVVITVVLLVYVVCCRPYHVAVANFFEALVITAQLACLSRNFWFLSADRTVAGVELGDVEAANAVYWIMMGSLVAMLLRLVSVMLARQNSAALLLIERPLFTAMGLIFIPAYCFAIP